MKDSAMRTLLTNMATKVSLSMAKHIPIYIVDAFTNKAFAGNPAAVCLLRDDIPDSKKQQIAAEMNLSETAFVVPKAKKGHSDENPFHAQSEFLLTWFTPETEVPLCGHATLASSAVLFFRQGNTNSLAFDTRYSGILHVDRSSLSEFGVEMRLPQNLATYMVNLADPDLAAVREIVQTALGREMARLSEVRWSPTSKKLLVVMENAFTRAQLEELHINKEKLTAVPQTHDVVKVSGLLITTRDTSQSTYDFLSRYFNPWVGIPEDPVTGSAHTVSGPYWADILGRKTLFARQCSKRGGEVRLEVLQDKVRVSGEAKVVLEGRFEL